MTGTTSLSAYWFVPPQCGFSLSLFCNYCRERPATGGRGCARVDVELEGPGGDGMVILGMSGYETGINPVYLQILPWPQSVTKDPAPRLHNRDHRFGKSVGQIFQVNPQLFSLFMRECIGRMRPPYGKHRGDAEPVANCNDPSGGAVVTELEVELGGADSVGVG